MIDWIKFENSFSKCVGKGVIVDNIYQCSILAKYKNKPMFSYYLNKINNNSKCLPSELCSENNQLKTNSKWNRYLKENNTWIKYGEPYFKCYGKGIEIKDRNQCERLANTSNVSMYSYYYNNDKNIHKCFISKPCIPYNIQYTSVQWQRYIINSTNLNYNNLTNISQFNENLTLNNLTNISQFNENLTVNNLTNISSHNQNLSSNTDLLAKINFTLSIYYINNSNINDKLNTTNNSNTTAYMNLENLIDNEPIFILYILLPIISVFLLLFLLTIICFFLIMKKYKKRAKLVPTNSNLVI